MKKIILTLFVTVCVSLFSQTGVCFNYHKSCTVKNSKNDKNWIITRIGRTSSGSGSGKIQNKHKKGSTSSNRITVSFKYVG